MYDNIRLPEIKERNIMADLIIRQAEEKDVPAIEEIEKQCFTVPWSYESLHKDIVENGLAFYVVAQTDGRVCGYVGIWKILDEGHITNVAVAPEFRRKHIGRAMLEALIDVTSQEGIEKYTLEVRASNQAAIRLYEGLGFKAEGIRPGYYEDNGEDAVIMWR